MARLHEAGAGKKRDRADLAALEPRVGVVAALILAVLVAQTVPVGSEIGETLRRGKITISHNSWNLVVNALVDLGSNRIVPATHYDYASRVLGAFGINSSDVGTQVDRSRTGDTYLYIQRLPG